MESRIILQVHDEIILEVPPAEEDAAWAATGDAMEHAVDLNVPLAVHLSWASNWAEAKE